MRGALGYDHRKDGSHGRALRVALPGGLRAGDRIEPSALVPDVGEGFDRMQCPGRVSLWRPSSEAG
eukprot:10850648-Alexandrium_andersonii.AAC.1